MKRKDDDLSRDLYTTIGGPVPALVWPRQENEQSPTRSEIEEPGSVTQQRVGDRVFVEGAPAQPPNVDVTPAPPHAFKVGDRVIVARKVERDSSGRWCFWTFHMDETIGAQGQVVSLYGDSGASVCVELEGQSGGRFYSPEALDIIEV